MDNEIITHEEKNTTQAETAAVSIGTQQLRELMQVLQKYKAGKARTEARIIASENWWKLRNTSEEQKETNIGADGGFTSRSGWLHNVIVSKHADAIEAYPEPNVLPREEGDRGEARKLSAIIPCVLEQNRFEDTYDDVMWQKLKSGTGAYKIVWDTSKLNGLGDITIEKVNLLNVYWEPGITDIQKSRYLFHTELWDKDLLEERYPDKVKGKLKSNTFVSAKFLYDDSVKTEDKATVIDVYYHKYINGKNTLQYIKFVGDILLYASENDTERPTAQATDAAGMPVLDPMGRPLTVETGPSTAERGLYDHGKYPYVFDPLFPIEGSPCGYGFVDLCRNPQTEIDLLKTSFVKSAMVGSMPRYLARGETGINEEEFLDLSKPIVHGTQIDENALRPIGFSPLSGNYINVLTQTIQELRETSGNTESATGTAPGGVTSASGIAALQEASGKGSKDSTKGSYRAYSEIVDFCIELIRQFYDMPRSFRILGQYGAEQFVKYSNAGIKPRHQGTDFGQDMGFRLPVFDIKVSAQKQNVYTKVSQNELALQFFKLGFFNPQMTDQAIMCLEIMDFDGKDGIMQKVAKNGTMMQKLLRYMQLALGLAQMSRPDMVEAIAKDMAAMTGGGAVSGGGVSAALPKADNVSGRAKKEHAVVENARARSQEASQPGGGRVVS